MSSQTSQSRGVDNKMNRERRRLVSAGAASTTVNQIQLSPTNRPASNLLPAAAANISFIQWGGGGGNTLQTPTNTTLNIINI